MGVKILDFNLVQENLSVKCFCSYCPYGNADSGGIKVTWIWVQTGLTVKLERKSSLLFLDQCPVQWTTAFYPCYSHMGIYLGALGVSCILLFMLLLETLWQGEFDGTFHYPSILCGVIIVNVEKRWFISSLDQQKRKNYATSF